MRSIRLTYVVNLEEGGYSSVCQELGTASCGATVDEALANLDEAVQVDLLALEYEGLLDSFFCERGLEAKASTEDAPVLLHLEIPAGAVVKSILCPLPTGS